MRLQFALILVLLFATPASQATEHEVADVPGDDIFGFTAPTDVGLPGDRTFAKESDGRFGKHNGSYYDLNPKFEFGWTIAENWWVGGSFYGAWNHSRGIADLNDINRIAFDGFSFEMERRLIQRSAQNPFAVSVALEPRWGRVDAVSGWASNAYCVAFKILIDAPIIPEKLYWAANLTWAPQLSQDPADRSRWLWTTSSLISTALTYQVSPKLFFGGEARHLAAFNSSFVSHRLGYAVYAGPTLLWKITDQIAVNATYQPQMTGRSKAKPGFHRDFEDFERAQYRIKLAITF